MERADGLTWDMSTTETTAYIFAGGMVCIGLCAISGCVYLFRRRSEERARELAMEQELADMIVRQRGIKHEIAQAKRMESGLNGTAFTKQKQLQMLQEARANLINVQNSHLTGGKTSSSKRKTKISQVQPATLEVKDDDSDNENRRKKKKRKSKVKKKRKSKVKKKKTKRAKRSKSRHGENSDNRDSESDTDISSSGGLSASKDSVSLENSGIAKTPKKNIESTSDDKVSTGAESGSDNKGGDSAKSEVQQEQEDGKAETASQNLPSLASPVRQNEKLDVMDSAQNVKAGLSIEHWLPNSIQMHFYEEFFKVADTKGKGKVKGKDAVKFLSKSGLSREILKNIWALSDFKKVGYLDKQSFLVACRFVAIIQYGVIKDDPEGKTLTLDVFTQHMNNNEVPLPQFDS